MGVQAGTWFNDPHLQRLADYGITKQEVPIVLRAFARHAPKSEWLRYKRVAEIALRLAAKYHTREGQVMMDPNQVLLDSGGRIFSEPEDEEVMKQELQGLLLRD